MERARDAMSLVIFRVGMAGNMCVELSVEEDFIRKKRRWCVWSWSWSSSSSTITEFIVVQFSWPDYLPVKASRFHVFVYQVHDFVCTCSLLARSKMLYCASCC